MIFTTCFIFLSSFSSDETLMFFKKQKFFTSYNTATIINVPVKFPSLDLFVEKHRKNEEMSQTDNLK